MVSRKTVNTMLISAIALTVAGGTYAAHAMDGNMDIKPDQEKCYGVAKAGLNDCGNAANTHACASQSAIDGDGGEWVAVPKGLCDKLANGSLTPIITDAEAPVPAAKDPEAEADEAEHNQ